MDIMSSKLRVPCLKSFSKKERSRSPFFDHIAKSLSLLEEQGELQSVINSVQLTDHILSLKLGLRFLEILFRVSTNKDLGLGIEGLVCDVTLEVHSLSQRLVDGILILDMDHIYNNLREKMKNVAINPDTQEYDVMLPKDSVYWRVHFEQITDFLLRISGDLTSYKADPTAPLNQEIEGMKELLMLLRPLHAYLAARFVCIPTGSKDFSALVALLDKAACLLYICSVGKEEMALAVKGKLSDLLEKTNVKQIYMGILRDSGSTISELGSLFKLLYNLIKLLDCDDKSVKYLNDPRKKLHDELNFLYEEIVDLPCELHLAKFNYLMTSIEDIAWKSIRIVYSWYVRDVAKGENVALSDVLDQIKHIQKDARYFRLYNCPKTNGLGFLDHFLGYLEELLILRPKLIENLKNRLYILHRKFDFLRSSLRKFKEHELEELGDIRTRIICLAYEAEYVIDLSLVKFSTLSYIMLSLSRIIEQTRLIEAKLKRIHKQEKYHCQAQEVARTPSFVPSQAIDKEMDEIVGFKKVAMEITEYLVGNRRQLGFISVVGMPGAGKTTLAKKIYESPSIVEHFDVRAWCTVSQTYKKRELLIRILGDVMTVTDDIRKSDDQELAEKVYKILKGRRYLIIFDDIWDIVAWNEMGRCFPNDNNHSRILITTRLQNVASKAKSGGKVLTLRQLTDDESWELFQKTLKLKESFSKDFLEVGQRISHSCKGLPLAIVVIARLLAKVEKSVFEWEKIARSLSSHLLSNSESSCMAILDLSYNHLSEHLKACFLYFAAFAEDEDIPVQKLKRLWIAEGYIHNNDSNCLESVAEECLKDLVSRSLVIATKESSLEGIKACRVHDLLYEFCLEKAIEESFLLHVDHLSKFQEVYHMRRLIFHSRTSDLTMAEPFGLSARSLLDTSTKSSVFGSNISFNCQNFKLLTVLNLPGVNISSKSFREIKLLILLRYLAVRADISSIPSSVSNLWNLQYFLLNSTTCLLPGVGVPDNLWSMGKLRHLCIHPSADFYIDNLRRFNDSTILDSLETLSTLLFPRRGDILPPPPSSCFRLGDEVSFLSRLTKLQKLKCVFDHYTWDESTKLWKFPELDCLGRLVSLKVIFNGYNYWGQRCELKFPSNLQKLTLSNCKVLWEDVSRFGSTLPRLKVLKVDDNPARGLFQNYKNYNAKWDVDGGDFSELRYLKLSRLSHFGEWVASEDSFPKLERLVLEWCPNLKAIPSSFGEIPTLQMITVRGCKKFVDDSARSIQREQQDFGNDKFKVYTYSGN